MSAIEFVVRDGTGAVTRGSVAGATGDTSIMVGAGQDVSLNLDRSNILSYVRQGQALQVTLVDGQTITIQGFFSPEGVAENELFISANGSLAKVDLTAGEGDLLYAQYADGDSFGKWSPDDDLYFVRGSEVMVAGVEAADADVGMLFTPLLGGLGGLSTLGAGAAALGAAAIVAGGGGDGGTDPTDPTDPVDPTDPIDPTDPPVDPTDPVDPVDPTTPLVVDITGGTVSAGVLVNNEDYIDGIEISGTGTAGASGTITVGGVSHGVTVDGSGNWTTTYTPEELDGGEYETDVSITLTSGTQTATATDTLVVDTIASVSVSVDTVEADGTVSFAEEADGVTLTGTTEAGSTVVVHIDGVDYNAIVTGESWSLDLAAGTIAQGEYDLNVSVTATDAHGNTASASDVVHIDTITSLSLSTAGTGGDGTINRVEHADGATVVGVAEANASVVVTMGNYSHTVDADANGNWSATFSATETPTGTLDMPVTAVSTDAVGNTATASGTIHIDTELDTAIDTSRVETDGTVNIVEHADGVTLNGTADAGAEVTVTFGTGTRVVTAGAGGTWSADWTTLEVPTGEVNAPVTVRATDSAGNVATANATVNIDTVIGVDINAGAATTGGGAFNSDGTVNFVEHANGVSLTGTSEGADTVRVNFGGVTRNATLTAGGSWTVDYAHGEFASGETDVPVTVTATDAAGNSATDASTINVDTFVNRLASAPSQVEGDDIVNNAEASDGIILNGVVEEGSTVMVTFENTTRSATVDADGNWTVHFDASEIPSGEYNATVQIAATDAAGNTASITDTFAVDTIAPDAADIETVTTGDTSTRGFSMLNVETGVSVDVSEFVNGSTDVAAGVDGISFANGAEMQHFFSDAGAVSDGSHLVVTTGDAAGNTNSTLLVLDQDGTSVVDMSSAAIGEFNIGAIDLEFADNSDLTLSVADLEGLSNNDNRLIVHGDTDDTVTLNGTATANGTTTINQQTYDVYTVGSNGGELIINQDIDFHQSVI